ncbi:unnamed protein product [Allacma fusca]|uniref:Uncharacterized protein n=1 Tax=Allacma fusca TaxID=39272 RepID=A0A8J2L1P3_9HEXA|nr:unnamed protein product [Allacma fusca]
MEQLQLAKMMFLEDELVPETEASIEVTSEPLYCLCQEPWDKHNRRFMIQCDHCKDWFHGSCIKLQEHASHDIEKYHCPRCVPLVGPSQNKEAGKKPIQAGTQVFIEKLKEKTFPSADPVVIKLRGNNLTLPHLTHKGFNRPIVVESSEGLGLKVPPETFTVRDVERYVGSERMLDVIDVQRQTDVKMTMREFADYFCSPARNKLYNLISLEFSKTNLNKLVEAPYITRKLDWVFNSWPNDLDEEIAQRPEVSKYCLVSTKDSYTDFHIDFGGTSVWYHILWGEKIFYLIEPTPANIALYARWMASTEQYESFFADSVDFCYRCVLKKGQTLFIPTGWIHAVLTPMDSLVFGGNFLHSLNMELQLQVYEIEKRLKVPAKYLFPGFEATHWFAAERVVDDLQTLNKIGNIPPHILSGAKALLSALRLWFSDKLITGPNYIGKYRREFIPPNINPHRILKDLTREVRMADKRCIPLKAAQHLIKSEEKLVTAKSGNNSGSKGKTNKLLGGTKDDSGDCMDVSSTSDSSVPSPSKNHSIVYEITKPRKDSHKVSKQSGSQPETVQKQVTPIKLKLTMSSRSSSQESDVFSSQSPKFRNGGDNIMKIDSDRHNQESSGQKDHLPKLRLSLSAGEGRVEMIESEPYADCAEPDLYIADSDNDLQIDTDEERPPSEDKNVHSRLKSKKRHKGKCRKKNERNLVLDQMLAGTLDGINELIKSANYTEKINAFAKDSSPMVKESFQDMLTMGEEVRPKRGKAKRNFNSSQSGFDAFDDTIEKVHQDDDFIYLPLAYSDDEGKSTKSKKSRREDDDTWSPRIKVGQLNPREHLPSRVGAKRKHVEKGLEKAAAKLATIPEKHEKRKYKARKKQLDTVDTSSRGDEKSNPPNTADKPGTSSAKLNHASPGRPPTGKPGVNAQRKPKKGMATPKQRLGKILGIHKFTKF